MTTRLPASAAFDLMRRWKTDHVPVAYAFTSDGVMFTGGGYITEFGIERLRISEGGRRLSLSVASAEFSVETREAPTVLIKASGPTRYSCAMYAGHAGER